MTIVIPPPAQSGTDNLPFLGCPWPIDPGCLGADWADVPADVQARSIAFASESLHRLTGYRVGGCPITVRPCAGGCCPTQFTPNDYMSPGSTGPRITKNGDWINCCGHSDCSCQITGAINLPAPVGEIVEVKINGFPVGESQYHLAGTYLVWDGVGGWPIDQDLSQPDTAVGTFSVTYLNAFKPDALGAYAAGVLASEFAKSCAGSNKCRLPSSVQSVTRQGVSFTMAAGLFPGGQTGLREVDAYVAMWNPNHIQQAPRVFSPDLR